MHSQEIKKTTPLEGLIYQLLTIIFIVGCFSLPISYETFIPGTSSKILYLIEPLCIISMGLFAVLWIVKRPKVWELRLNLFDKLICFHFVAVFISTIYSDDLFVSIKYTATIIWYVSFGYLIPRVVPMRRKHYLWAVLAHLGGMAVLGVYCLYNWSQLGIFYESSYDVAKPFLEIGHTNLSVLFELPLFLVAGLFLLARKTLVRNILLGIAFTLCLAVILFSCSKASYLTILISFVIFLLGTVRLKGKKTVLYLLGASVVLGILGFAVLKGYMVKVLEILHFGEYKNYYLIIFVLAYGGLLFYLRKKKLGKLLIYTSVPLILLIGVWYYNDYVHHKKYANTEGSYYADGSKEYDSNDQRTYKPTSIIAELAGVEEANNNHSNLERKNRWKIGIKMALDFPMAGVGMGTFPDKYLLVKKQQGFEQTYLTNIRMNIHNMYLSWFVEGGVITFVSGILLVLVIGFRFFQHVISGKHSMLKLCLFIFFVAVLVHGVAHDFSQDARVIIPFWTAVALLGKMGKPLGKKAKPTEV